MFLVEGQIAYSYFTIIHVNDKIKNAKNDLGYFQCIFVGFNGQYNIK